LGVATEASYASGAVPNRWFEYKTESMKLSRAFLLSQQLRAGRLYTNSSRRSATTRSAAGAVSFEVPSAGLGPILNLLHGNTVVPAQQGGTAAYLQTHSIGATDPYLRSLCMQIGKPTDLGVVQSYTYPGTVPTSVAFDCQTGGFLECILTADANDEQVTGAYEVDTLSLGAASAGSITYAITWQGVTYTTAAIAYNASNATVQAAMLAATGPAAQVLPAGTITVTGGPLPAAITITYSGAMSGPVTGQNAVPTGLTGGTIAYGVTTAGAGGGPLGTAAYTAGLHSFNFVQCAVAVNGVVQPQARGCNLTINTPRDTGRYYLGKTTKAVPLTNAYHSATAAVTVDYADNTLYNLFASAAVVPVTITYTGPVIAGAYTEMLQFSIAAAGLDGDSPVVNGPGILQQQIPLVVLDNGVTAPIVATYVSVDTVL
ncbi:MAG: hypothetical protein M3N95_17930, partial [Actinomycetota bacterium]|nr:hypothetical protein [Actinomycetota bacterium]